MAQIKMPTPQADSSGKLLTVAGGIAGAMSGAGPAGAMMGAMMGAQAGSMAGSLLSENRPQIEQVGGNAMMRRQARLDESPLRQIRESIDSLKYIQDDGQRMALAEPLVRAQIQAQKGLA